MGIQLVIEFLDIFKGSLGQNSERQVLGLGAEQRELRLSLPWQLVLFYLPSLMFSILFFCFISITMSS